MTASQPASQCSQAPRDLLHHYQEIGEVVTKQVALTACYNGIQLLFLQIKAAPYTKKAKFQPQSEEFISYVETCVTS